MSADAVTVGSLAAGVVAGAAAGSTGIVGASTANDAGSTPIWSDTTCGCASGTTVPLSLGLAAGGRNEWLSTITGARTRGTVRPSFTECRGGSSLSVRAGVVTDGVECGVVIGATFVPNAGNLRRTTVRG